MISSRCCSVDLKNVSKLIKVYEVKSEIEKRSASINSSNFNPRSCRVTLKNLSLKECRHQKSHDNDGPNDDECDCGNDASKSCKGIVKESAPDQTVSEPENIEAIFEKSIQAYKILEEVIPSVEDIVYRPRRCCVNLRNVSKNNVVVDENVKDSPVDLIEKQEGCDTDPYLTDKNPEYQSKLQSSHNTSDTDIDKLLLEHEEVHSQSDVKDPKTCGDDLENSLSDIEINGWLMTDYEDNDDPSSSVETQPQQLQLLNKEEATEQQVESSIKGEACVDNSASICAKEVSAEQASLPDDVGDSELSDNAEISVRRAEPSNNEEESTSRTYSSVDPEGESKEPSSAKDKIFDDLVKDGTADNNYSSAEEPYDNEGEVVESRAFSDFDDGLLSGTDSDQTLEDLCSRSVSRSSSMRSVDTESEITFKYVPGLESNTKSTQPPPRTSIRVLAKQISQENNQLTNRGVKRKSRGKSLESVNLPSRKRLKNTSASKDDKDEALEPGSQETSAPNDKPRFSDQKGDYIVFICSICSFEGHYRKLLAHLKKQHSLNITEYKKIYGKSETKEKILHKCKICHDSIEFIYDTLTSHFRSKHDGFNIKKYVACFLDGDDPKGENLESSQQTISASGNFSSVRAHHKMIHQGDHQLEDSAEKSVELGNIDVNPVEQSQEALDKKKCRGNEEREDGVEVMVDNDTSNNDVNSVEQPEKALNKVISQCKKDKEEVVDNETTGNIDDNPGEEPVKDNHTNSAVLERISDVPGDYMTFKCGLCGYICQYKGMQKHLRLRHNTTITEFKMKYGDLQVWERVQHKCKICDKMINYSHDNLYRHLLKFHKITMKKYHAKYDIQNRSQISTKKPQGGSGSCSPAAVAEEDGITTKANGALEVSHPETFIAANSMAKPGPDIPELGNSDVNPVEQSQEALNQKKFRGNEEHEGSAGVMVVNDTSNKDQAGKKTFLEQNRGQISTQKSQGGSGSCSFAAVAEEDGITTKTNGAADVSHPETFIAANSMAKAGPDNPEVRPVKRRKSVGRSTRGRPLPISKPAAVTNERNWM